MLLISLLFENFYIFSQVHISVRDLSCKVIQISLLALQCDDAIVILLASAVLRHVAYEFCNEIHGPRVYVDAM